MLTSERKPFFHGVSDREPPEPGAKDKFAKKGDEGEKGDGRHHHEIHEDEGGGYHSKHTHPDGREEHADHATYHEAVAHMHEKFGKEPGEAEPDGDEANAGEDFGAEDAGSMAANYGRRGARG